MYSDMTISPLKTQFLLSSRGDQPLYHPLCEPVTINYLIFIFTPALTLAWLRVSWLQLQLLNELLNPLNLYNTV